MKRRKKRKLSRKEAFRYFGYAALCSLAAYLAVSTGLNRSNTLFANGRWQSTKTTLAKGVNGGAAFMVTRRALLGGQLDLSAWFGFQEILHAKPLRLKAVEFEFRLEPEAYLVFIFGKDELAFEGVRFSANEKFPGSEFAASTSGAFTRIKPFEAPLSPGWNRLRAEFGAKSLSLALNGQALKSVETNAGERQGLFGFRSGVKPAYVRNVTVEGADPQDGFFEDFQNRRRFWVWFPLAIAALALLGLAGARLLKVDPLYMQFVLLLASGAGYFFDSKYLWPLYLEPQNIDYSGFHSVSSFESHETAAARIRSELPSKPGGSWVLFLGTSQTWGAGAFTVEDTYVSQLQKKLDQDFGKNRHRALNAGFCGGDSNVVLRAYKGEWIKLQPRAVVVDLSNNDPETGVFTANLKELVALNNARGIRTLFVLEANAAETSEEGPTHNREAMRAVAKELGIPLVDLHQEVKKGIASGFLWWDTVHFTAHGAKLASDAIYPALKKLLD